MCLFFADAMLHTGGWIDKVSKKGHENTRHGEGEHGAVGGPGHELGEVVAQRHLDHGERGRPAAGQRREALVDLGKDAFAAVR
jgi:hypothetical protein